MRTLLFTFLLSIVLSSAMGQLVISTDLTIEEYVLQTFGNQFYNISNVHYNNGNANVIGLSAGGFTAENSAINIANGIAISNGDVSMLLGPNNTNKLESIGDEEYFSLPLLEDIIETLGDYYLGTSVEIEFDFVASYDSIAIDYIWGSEEYSASIANRPDCFAIFLTGPGIDGPGNSNTLNIATIPGTDSPISTLTLNNGSAQDGPCTNCEYFNQPMADSTFVINPIDINDSIFYDSFYPQFDAYSDRLPARAAVQCGETYHISFIIGHALYYDFPDFYGDSGVFLTADIPGYSSQSILQADNTTSLFETCEDAEITLSRPAFSNPDEDLTINLLLSGTAIEGSDYNTLPDALIITAGQNNVSLPIQVMNDGISESNETIILNLSYQGFCSSITESIILTIDNSPEPMIVEGDTIIGCSFHTPELSPQVTGGSGNFTYEWNTEETTAAIEVMVSGSQTYSVNVTDVCTGETAMADFIVHESNAELLTILVPDTIHEGCSFHFMTIGANGGVPSYSYFLNDIFRGTSPDSLTFQYQAPAMDTYTIDVVDGCGTIKTRQVIPDAFLPLHISFPDTIIASCFDTLFQPMPDVISGGPIESTNWSWLGSPYYTISNFQPWEEEGPASGYLFVVARNECYSYDSAFTWLEAGIGSPPVIGDDLICLGDIAELSTSDFDQVEYQWFLENEPILNEVTTTLETAVEGTYSLQITTDMCGGGSAMSAPFFLEVSNPPAAEFSYTNDGPVYQFYADVTEGNEIFWDFGDGATSNEWNPQHTFLELGMQSVQVQVMNEPCPDLFELISVNVTGLYELESTMVKPVLFPNPTTGNTWLRTKSYAVPVELTIFSAMGNIISSYTILPQSRDIELDTDGLAPGTYTVKISFSDQHQYLKLIKVAD